MSASDERAGEKTLARIINQSNNIYPPFPNLDGTKTKQNKTRRCVTRLGVLVIGLISLRDHAARTTKQLDLQRHSKTAMAEGAA